MLCPCCNGSMEGEELAGAAPYHCDTCEWEVGAPLPCGLCAGLEWRELAEAAAGLVAIGPQGQRHWTDEEAVAMFQAWQRDGAREVRRALCGLALFAWLMALCGVGKGKRGPFGRDGDAQGGPWW